MRGFYQRACLSPGKLVTYKREDIGTVCMRPRPATVYLGCVRGFDLRVRCLLCPAGQRCQESVWVSMHPCIKIATYQDIKASGYQGIEIRHQGIRVCEYKRRYPCIKVSKYQSIKLLTYPGIKYQGFYASSQIAQYQCNVYHVFTQHKT